MPSTIHLHRVLATSPEKVYRAFLQADALAKWLPPNGFACTVHHLEPELGGTSMVASKGVPGASTYSASKAAVESLTRTWAAEFGSRGVRVNSVAPGPTKTDGVQAEWGDVNEELGRALPLGRTAGPDEIANAVLFLASPRSSFITGSTLHADGGGTAI